MVCKLLFLKSKDRRCRYTFLPSQIRHTTPNKDRSSDFRLSNFKFLLNVPPTVLFTKEVTRLDPRSSVKDGLGFSEKRRQAILY